MYIKSRRYCRMLDKIVTDVGTPDWRNINKEMTPILADLVVLGPNNEHHPAVIQLFEWLVNPHRTGDEYAYVVGILADEVFRAMEQDFPNYIHKKGCFPYLCTTAAEALAERCPILEGAWEKAAWTLLLTTQLKQPYKGLTRNDLSVSEHLNAWLILVIADPDLCPNCYLRLDLLELLMRMVHINEYNFRQVMEAILSVLSSINIDYIIGLTKHDQMYHALESLFSTYSSPNIDHLKANLKVFEGIKLSDITGYLGNLNIKEQLMEFDKKLATQILDLKSSRCAAVVHDVRYLSAVNPKIFSEPQEFYGLLNMLKYSVRIIQGYYSETLIENYCKKSILILMNCMSDTLFIIISSFSLACQTPQLVGITSLCIMDMVELAIKVNEEIDEEDEKDCYVNIFNQLGLQKINKLLTSFIWGYEDHPLPCRPIRLNVIKHTIRGMLNDYKWNLLVCNDVFYEYFPHDILLGNGVQYE